MEIKIILLLLIIVALSISSYYAIELIQRRKIKKYSTDNFKQTKQKKDKKTGFRIGNQEKIRLKLIQAGHPFKDFLDESNYYFYKIGLCTLATLAAIDNGAVRTFRNLILGFFILDIYVGMKIRKRKNEIRSVLDKLVSITIDGLESGQIPAQIMPLVIQKIPEKNPLSLELKLLSRKLYKGDIKKALKEFKKRVDMEEIDNYCNALTQYETGGRAVDMLKLQLDILNSIQTNRKQRETQRRSNYSSLAVAILVGALLLIFIVPFVAKIRQMPLS